MADHFVIISQMGKAYTPPTHNYYSILQRIYEDYQTGALSGDRPDKLLCNGVIVVESGLCDMAWKYGSALKGAIQEATGQVRIQYQPDWMLS